MSLPPYRLQWSRGRRRSIRLAVHADGSLVVTAARSIPRSLIEDFVQRKMPWIQRRLQERDERPPATLQGDREEFLLLRETAHAFVKERLTEIVQRLGLSYTMLTIRNTRSRWGSCSRRGAISIHYKILFLPLNLAEYLLVHEACHLKEMNHGPRFWKLVSQLCPDAYAQRRMLRTWIWSSTSLPR